MTVHRLLIMACSATKKPGQGYVPARERYDGPLWRTYRTYDPRGSRAALMFLSAHYGLREGSNGILAYDKQMTPAIAAEMKRDGMDGQWPKVPGRWSPCVVSQLCIAHDGRKTPFVEVCMVGGELYVDVMAALVKQLRANYPKRIAPDAKLHTINGGIGYMRAELRSWLLGESNVSLPFMEAC